MVDVNAMYITPITPPVYIHQGPAGNGESSVDPKIINSARKISRNVVPIMKFNKEVVKLWRECSLI
jgi:hypothetical protein